MSFLHPGNNRHSEQLTAIFHLPRCSIRLHRTFLWHGCDMDVIKGVYDIETRTHCRRGEDRQPWSWNLEWHRTTCSFITFGYLSFFCYPLKENSQSSAHLSFSNTSTLLSSCYRTTRSIVDSNWYHFLFTSNLPFGCTINKTRIMKNVGYGNKRARLLKYVRVAEKQRGYWVRVECSIFRLCTHYQCALATKL